MKKIIILLCLLMSLIGKAQEYFSLELKLVKPSGKIDKDAYLEATLSNLSDSTIYVRQDPKPIGLYHAYISPTSYLVFDYQKKNGEIETGFSKVFFDYNKRVLLILPREKVKYKDAVAGYPQASGAIPYYAIGDAVKIRCSICKFDFGIKNAPKAYYPNSEYISNWVDIQYEDFSYYDEHIKRWNEGPSN